MEENYRKLLEGNRSKFCSAISAERLISPIAVSHILSSEELQSIQNEVPTKRVDKLIDALLRLDYNAFKKFCVVLETTYPYMLNCMFLNVEPPASAISRLEKDNQKKVLDKDFEGNTSRFIQCGPRRINVGRSTSMTGHDFCRDRYSILKNELKSVKWDLEQVKSELQRTEKERDAACHELAELTGQKRAENIENNTSNESCDDSSDYERLKHEYVNVLTELQILRQQNSDINEKHSIANQEADYFRRQHKAVLNKCDMLVREAQGLHRKLEESFREQEKIRQDYEEIVLLREREKFEMKDRSVDLLIDRHESGDEGFAVEKCENLEKENSQLQETHRELRSEYNHVFSRLQSMEADFISLKDQFENLIKERDNLSTELGDSKQRNETINKNKDKVSQELDNVMKALHQVKQERDRIMNLQIKTARELAKVNEERTAAVNEYKLVMSERDNVHRETEKIQDRLNSLQESNHFLMEEKDKISNNNTTLQDEIHLLSTENDKLLGEVYVLQKKCSTLQMEYKNMIIQRDKAADDSEMLKQERDAARRERCEAIIHRDKILKDCFKVKQKQDLVLKGEAKEIDAFRKQFQILSKELTAAHQEADVAKQRCEWALIERGKAISEQKRLWRSQELLQEDYNRLLGDVNEMLHESDSIRSQHNENMMELVDLKHCIQSTLSSKGSAIELLSSRDSAIDTDSMEWETESVVIEKSNNDLGIMIGGGRDTPLMPNDSSIVVTDVTKGSVADGKLKVNDCLLKVNDLDLTNVEHKTAVQAITKGSVINLTVRRRRSCSVKSISHAIRLTQGEGNELGIEVDESKYIRFISPGSVAAQHPILSVGDKIVTINGVSIENLSQQETKKLMSTSTVSLALQKSKPPTPTHTLHSLLEEVNNKLNNESDVYQHAHSHRKKLLTMDSASTDMYEQHRHGQKELYSAWSSPSVEEHTQDSRYISEQLNTSLSLQPLYEEREEKSKGTQTDSSETSIDSELNGDSSSLPCSAEFGQPVSNHSLSTAFTNHSMHRTVVNGHAMPDNTSHTHSSTRHCNNEHHDMKDTHHLSQRISNRSPPIETHSWNSQYSEEKPLPPPRSCSFITSLIATSTAAPHSSQHYVMDGQGGRHSSVMNEYPSDVNHGYVNQPSRIGRPQSAPTARQQQHLPYTSHLDPLALTMPKLHPTDPQASVSVPTSQTVPFYTAKSYVIPRYNTPPPETRQSPPVQGSNSLAGSRKVGAHITNDHSSSIYHSRQGSSHSADEFDFRHQRQRSLDSSNGPKSSNRLHNRMSLPGYQFSSQPCFPSGISSSSVGSTSSMSSGQVTPLRTPTTPFVPVLENEVLAFSFSNPGPHSTTSDHRDAEPRLVHIEKKNTLGISIAPGNNGGIFVCSVSKGSVAEKAGLKYGDQLLEYNGVNLRCANYEQAAKILKESGNSVTILAQFNPERALEGDFDIGNSSASETSSTACSTPVNRRKVKRDDSTITPPLPKDEKVVPLSDGETPGDIRTVYLNHTSTNLGFNIAGGNATGIFVAEVDQNSEVAKLLNVGDQILEYDGHDMLSCTAELALLEFCKPTRPVKALVQYNPAKFNVIKDQPGDSFYVRCLYDHTAQTKDELSFKTGDILYITDTIYQGYIGYWKACLVSPDDAQRRDNGVVPSRMKAEQEILLHRSLAALHGDDHRLSGRRSLFRRSKKSSHSLIISHSREGSDSAASITSATELGLVSYQTVEKLDSHIARPVVIFGPLAEVICEKLACDFPYNFVNCKPELVNISREKADKCIAEGTFVDYSWKGGHLSCTLLSSLQKTKDKHPLLEVNPEAIERLHALQVYPIVVFVKFKSYKSVKEIKDIKYITERITSKDAKEMFESAQRLEREYKSIFNGVVHGHSLTTICTAVQECVNDQQKKTIWVPLTSV